ncbi:MAG: glycoside hydrolase family 5 protein [Verrucomicrobiota bacterium]|jgi:endoglucanase
MKTQLKNRRGGFRQKAGKFPFFENAALSRVAATIFIATVLSGCKLEPVPSANKAAFTPANPPEMRRLTDRNSPAYRAAKLFQHGVNLGNYLEVPPGQNWGVTASADEFAIMHAEGFDHLRVPVGWHHYAGPAPDFKLSPEIFSRVDFVVTNALAAGLAVMINIHHFDELDENPRATTDEFLQIWRQIAAHYRNFPAQLAFELDNEPHAKATTAEMNPIYARAIAEIRKTNPRRTIFVEPGNWGSVDELKNLVLPPDDNVIVSVHCYEPFYFTHQGATWAGADTKVTGIRFPGPPATPLVPDPSLKLNPWVTNWIARYNTLPTDENPSSPIAFNAKIKLARAWSDYYGRPVHFGEFGCFTTADPASRANFYSAFRCAAEAQNIGWCIWDWSAGFRYWDKKNNQPMPGMREALFGKPK